MNKHPSLELNSLLNEYIYIALICATFPEFACFVDQRRVIFLFNIFQGSAENQVTDGSAAIFWYSLVSYSETMVLQSLLCFSLGSMTFQVANATPFTEAGQV